MTIDPVSLREAVAPGTELPALTISGVDPDRIRMVALLLRDPNPIHFDLNAVAAAGLGDRFVCQGGTTLGYVYDLLIAWAGSRAAVRRVSCRFHANVFAGDTVTAGGQIVEVRPVTDALEVDCEVWIDRDDGTRVLSGRCTVLRA